MTIELTDEQMRSFLEDEWLNIKGGGYRIYVELDNQLLSYLEFAKMNGGKTEQGYAVGKSDLEKMHPKRPNDPSYYRNDPLCPNCATYMIYKFEHCPRCGQKLDWSGE